MEIWTGSKPELDRRAAVRIAAAIAERAKTQAAVVLALVGGRSVGGIFEHLRSAPLPWERVHVFLADERFVPLDSDESNYKLVKTDLLDALIEKGRLPAANAHRFAGDSADPDQAVQDYTRALDAVGGRFDIAVLSAGEDGHVASLFPHHPSIASDANGFIKVENSPKPPPRRVSASRRLLSRTQLGILVLYGEGKREAWNHLRDTSLTVDDCPSKLIETMPVGIALTDMGGP